MNSTVMKGSTLPFARSGSRGGVVHIDRVTVGLVLSIVLLGLVMVTSASISIASKETGDVFYYLERQLILTLLGGAAAALLFCIPTRLIEKISTPLLIIAIGLLFLRARARPRARGEWQPPLDSPARIQLPAPSSRVCWCSLHRELRRTAGR